MLGVGPQIGFLFPVGDMQGYLNLKGYGEFAAENGPAGWLEYVADVLDLADGAGQHSGGPADNDITRQIDHNRSVSSIVTAMRKFG